MGTSIKTPRPTSVKTPKPTKDRTPKPTSIKTPRPTSVKTPRPTIVRDPHPTRMKTPRPTKGEKTPKPTKNKTPRPTVWSPPKTPRPTKGEKTPKPTRTYIQKTPKPTSPPKTPKPTNPPKTPRPTQTYIQPTPKPTMGGGWGPVAPEPEPTDAKVIESKPSPLVGCAENTAKKSCNGDVGGCVWMEGYPPLAFSEDSDYQLLAEESFFAVDGSVVEMIGNMDSNMLMLFGVMFVAVLLFATRQFWSSKKKVVADVNASRRYGSFVEVPVETS